jgi:hypothetical protein
MRSGKYILAGLIILLFAVVVFTTVRHRRPPRRGRAAVNVWYIDPANGSTRYDPTVNVGGICNGHGPNPPVGNTINQDCPFKDIRYLFFDGRYTTTYQPWIIAGGDIVHIAPGQLRVGYETGANNGYVDAAGYDIAVAGNPFTSGMPPPPSGTAAQHTQFIGAGSTLTQIFAGYGAYAALDLGSSAFVDVIGIEFTRHSQCIIFGSPAVPSNCSSSTPLDDYAKNGLTTNPGTHDILLQDLNIHGFTSRGIIGPIGGIVTATNVTVSTNGGAGWDFDDGNSTPSINAQLIADGLIIEWNGCNQAYPGPGAISCYGQSSGGYGDGIGTPTGTCISATVKNSIFRYNTQDGYDMLHNDTGNCKQTVSYTMAYGNNGQQFKWGNANSGSTLTYSTIVANCFRLSAPFPGQPAGYNANLQDFCRAGDAIALNFIQGTTMTLDHDTIITTAPVTLDIACVDNSTCSNSVLKFTNNIVRGYSDPNLSYNGHGAPAGWCLQGCNSSTLPMGTITSTNNVWYGLANFTPAAGEVVADPLFVNQPPSFVNQATLDNYNTNLTSGSPAVSMGAGAPGTIVDVGTGGTPPPTVTLSSITVTPNPGTVVVGATLNMTCIANYSDSTTGGCVAPEWFGSGGHTTIDSSGVVTGAIVGSDTITASISPISGTATVNVTSSGGGGGGGGGGGQPIVVGGVQITPAPTVTVSDPRVINGHVAFNVTTTTSTTSLVTVFYKNNKLKYLSCSVTPNGEAVLHGLAWSQTNATGNTLTVTARNGLQPGEALNVHVDCWTS